MRGRPPTVAGLGSSGGGAPAWVAAGFGRCSFARHRERVAKAIRRTRDNRRPGIFLAVTVARMLDELRTLGLVPTRLGIDMALRAVDDQRTLSSGAAVIVSHDAGTNGGAQGPRESPQPAAAAGAGTVRAGGPGLLRIQLGVWSHDPALGELALDLRQATQLRLQYVLVGFRLAEVAEELSRVESHPRNRFEAQERCSWRRECAIVAPELADGSAPRHAWNPEKVLPGAIDRATFLPLAPGSRQSTERV